MTGKLVSAVVAVAFMATIALAAEWKVGDRVEAWNLMWSKGVIVKVDTGGYLVHHDAYATDSYYSAKNLRRPASATKPAASDGLRSTAASRGAPGGAYTCGVYLSQRYTPTGGFTLSGGRYKTHLGGSGSATFDPSRNRLDFTTGPMAELFGRYEWEEAHKRGVFRVIQKKDEGLSTHRQNWRAQYCAPQ